MGLSVPKAPKIAMKFGGKGAAKAMPKGLGNDPVHLMKKFFLYRNVFGNETGAPGNGGMPNSLVGGLGKAPQSNPGDILAFASARRMGIL